MLQQIPFRAGDWLTSDLHALQDAIRLIPSPLGLILCRGFLHPGGAACDLLQSEVQALEIVLVVKHPGQEGVPLHLHHAR